MKSSRLNCEPWTGSLTDRPHRAVAPSGKGKLLCIGMMLWAACTSQDKTRIVVVVGSDLSVPGEMDTIRIDVSGPNETKSKNFPLATTGKMRLPIAYDLAPGGSQDEAFGVKATALRAGQTVVWQEARLSFIPRQSRVLSFFLGRACAGTSCDLGHTCSAGSCVQAVDISSAILPIFDPKHPPVPYAPDAAMTNPDGGLDSSTAEAEPSSLDAEGLDSAMGIGQIDGEPAEAPGFSLQSSG
jgi:hypothetical protein